MSWAPGPRVVAASSRDRQGSLIPARPSEAAGDANQAGAGWLPPASRSSSRSRGSSGNSWGRLPGLVPAGPRAMVGGGGEGGSKPGRRRELAGAPATADRPCGGGRARGALDAEIRAGRGVERDPRRARRSVLAARAAGQRSRPSGAPRSRAKPEPTRRPSGLARRNFAAHWAPCSEGSGGGAGRGGRRRPRGDRLCARDHAGPPPTRLSLARLRCACARVWRRARAGVCARVCARECGGRGRGRARSPLPCRETETRTGPAPVCRRHSLARVARGAGRPWERGPPAGLPL